MDKTSKIFKIFSGDASAEDIAEIEAWANRDPLNRRDFNDVKQFCSDAELYAPDEDVVKRYDSLLIIQQKVQRDVRRRRKISAARWSGVLIVMFICNGYLSGLFSLTRHEDNGIRYENLAVQILLSELVADYGVTTIGLPQASEDRHVSVVFYGLQKAEDLTDALERGLHEMTKEGKGQ